MHPCVRRVVPLRGRVTQVVALIVLASDRGSVSGMLSWENAGQAEEITQRSTANSCIPPFRSFAVGIHHGASLRASAMSRPRQCSTGNSKWWDPGIRELMEIGNLRCSRACENMFLKGSLDFSWKHSAAALFRLL
mmetsp:Transcript_12527/g.24142  ORF Transcript_12527/g.24142 Transcript_12527/m.24142 type:complete len:135 (+) Transcript_12527:1114-1518(+)